MKGRENGEQMGQRQKQYGCRQNECGRGKVFKEAFDEYYKEWQ
jgi:hypothetical protein